MFYTKREYYSLSVKSLLMIKQIHFLLFCIFFVRIYHEIPLHSPLYHLAQGDHNNICCNHAITVITKIILLDEKF